MGKIQLIKEEIERLLKENKHNQHNDSIEKSLDKASKYRLLYELKKFIDSLLEELPASEDLEEELDNFLKDPVFGKLINRNAGIVLAHHFAEWQKQQMYKLLGEQITLNYNSGYEKGLKDKEEEMLRDAIDFFYMQINGGDMEVKDIKDFIEQFKNYMQNE